MNTYIFEAELFNGENLKSEIQSENLEQAKELIKSLYEYRTLLYVRIKQAYHIYNRSLLRGVVTGLNSYVGYFVSLEKLQARTTAGLIELVPDEVFHNYNHALYFLTEANNCTTTGIQIGTESSEKKKDVVSLVMDTVCAMFGVPNFTNEEKAEIKKQQDAKGIKEYGCDIESSKLPAYGYKTGGGEELYDAAKYLVEYVKRR